MKAIKLHSRTNIDYKEEFIEIPDYPVLVPDFLAKVLFEIVEEKELLSIRKSYLKHLNLSYLDKKPKKVLVLADLDAFSSVCLMPILKAIEKESQVDVYPFSNKDIYVGFGTNTLKDIPSLDDILSYDVFYVLFEEDLTSYEFDTSNRISYFERFFDVEAITLEPFLEHKPSVFSTFINSQGFYKANIKNTSNIEKSITIPQNIFTKSSLNKIFDALKSSKVIITTHPAVAYICHVNKIPCVFVVGGFDKKVFGEISYVKCMEIPFVGAFCSGPCMRISEGICVEAKVRGSNLNPCMDIESIPDQIIQDAIEKSNKELVKEDACKYCLEKAPMHLLDVLNADEYRECSTCKSIIFSKKEHFFVEKGLSDWGIPGFFSFYKDPIALSMLDKMHNIDIAYILKASKLKGSVLVYRAFNGEISHLLNYLGYETVNVEEDEELKKIGFVLFGTKYYDGAIEDVLSDIDIVLIPDIRTIDTGLLKIFKDKHILIGAPNKESILNTLGRYKSSFKSSLTPKAFINLFKHLGKDLFLYSSNELSQNSEYFGEFFSNILTLSTGISLSLFEHENFYKLKAKYGTYIYGSSFPIHQNSQRPIDYSKWNMYEKSVFKFHMTNRLSENEPYIEIYAKGPKGKVLITDHWELISNYPELFASKGYTVGVLRKDIPLNPDRLKNEVKAFNPDFMFFGFYGDLFFMRNETSWDYKTRDFWFKNFDVPIIALKVDTPSINRYSLTREGLEILRKYKHKFAIIHHDKFLTECFRTLGIKAYWWNSNGFIMSNLNLSTQDDDTPKEEKTFDVIFPGSLHKPNEDFYKKYAPYIECYKKDVSDIRKCLDIPCIKDGFFNQEFFDISTSVMSYVRAYATNALKDYYKDRFFTTDVIKIPYSRLKYIVSSSKITFYIHSQGFSAVHDMIYEPPIYHSLPIVDYKEEAMILFPEHYKEITYTNIEDAIKKIDYYLSHEEERESLIKELRNIVLNYYRQDFRIDMIEYVLTQLKV